MKKIISQIVSQIQKLQSLKDNYEARQTQKKSVKKPVKKVVTTSKSSPPQVVTLEISLFTIVKVVLVVAAFLALSRIFIELQSIIIVSVVCFFMAMGLSPILDVIESKHVPRPLAILVLYIIFLGAVGILFVKVIPILGEQLSAIASDLRRFLDEGALDIPILEPFLKSVQFNSEEVQMFLSTNLVAISRNLQNVAGSTFSILSGVFQGVFNFIFALVLLFFILMERETIGRFLLALFPRGERSYILEKSESIQRKMSEWFRGQVVLMICMGLFMYIGMKGLEWTLGMKYAATIGLLSAFMELFPYIGVLITGFLAGLIALNVSWVLLLAVLIWMLVAQFLEGNFLVPLIMERVVGLSAVVTILALAIGGILGYAVGGVPLSILAMIFAIPVAASVAIFVEEYAKKSK